MINREIQREIPIFMSIDENYLPFWAVAVRSVIENADPQTRYVFYVLYESLSANALDEMATMNRDNIEIHWINVRQEMEPLYTRLHLRDYYTPAIYYRLLIPTLFPAMKRAIYLDSDVVAVDDIAQLYDRDIGTKWIAAVPDEVVAHCDVFRDYVERYVGVRHSEYFNSGVLLMNLERLRAADIQAAFFRMIDEANFRSVAPDQDFLNALCRGNVYYLEKGWNKMTVEEAYSGDLHIVHYNMFCKPWRYENVPFERFFWRYAAHTSFHEALQQMKAQYTPIQRMNDARSERRMLDTCRSIMASSHSLVRMVTEVGSL